MSVTNPAPKGYPPGKKKKSYSTIKSRFNWKVGICRRRGDCTQENCDTCIMYHGAETGFVFKWNNFDNGIKECDAGDTVELDTALNNKYCDK